MIAIKVFTIVYSKFHARFEFKISYPTRYLNKTLNIKNRRTKFDRVPTLYQYKPKIT
jgi:hypothetical protein